MIQSKGRQYEVDGVLVTIPHDILNKMRSWNTETFSNDTNYDMKIVQALLVLCVGSDAISAGNISDKVLKFVKGNNQTSESSTGDLFINTIASIRRGIACACSWTGTPPREDLRIQGSTS